MKPNIPKKIKLITLLLFSFVAFPFCLSVYLLDIFLELVQGNCKRHSKQNGVHCGCLVRFAQRLWFSL